MKERISITQNSAEKARKAFGDEGGERDYANEFLAELRVNWRDNEKSLTRAGVLMVALGAIFELVANNAIGEASVLFVKLSDTRFLILGIPPVIAYLYHYSMHSLVESWIFSEVHDEVVRVVYPKISSESCEQVLHPANSFTSSPARVFVFVKETEGRFVAVGVLLALFRPLAIILTPSIFLGIAYYQSIHLDILQGAPLIVSALITAVYTLAGLGYVSTVWRG